MSLHAKLIISAVILANAVLVIELLRRRRLTESYTLLWLFVLFATAVAMWADRFLFYLTRLLGAIVPVSTLTLLSLAFILVMLIFFSMKISQLTKDLKDLAQQVALRAAPPAPGTEGAPGNDRTG